MAFGEGLYSGLDLVFCNGDCIVRGRWAKGVGSMEAGQVKSDKRKGVRGEVMSKLTDFAKGIIAGVVGTAIIFGVIIVFHFLNKRDKELIEYAEKQQAIEVLREDYVSRDPYEFIEAIPGVSGAVDGAAAGFIRKRDEALQRLRDSYTN